MARTLSSYVQRHPECITPSLQKLSCTSQDITDVDIHPAVLAMLVKEAPVEVTHAAAGLLSAHDVTTADAPACTARRRQQRNVGQTSTAPEGSYFNVAVALALNTVLLSRNRLTSLLGVVQFRNVVRLSVLGNYIRRIEDCEPLALLPQLMFLSLEYNPVAGLPHYRAHLLRITAWPQPLSLTNCRLRRLDGREVGVAEVAQAMRCLQREEVLLPELLHRQRLLSFARDALHRQRLHAELRRRGVLFAEHQAACTVSKLLRYGTDSALTSLDDSAATHAIRRLVQRIVSAPHRINTAADHLSASEAANQRCHTDGCEGHVSASMTYLTSLTDSTSSTTTAEESDAERGGDMTDSAVQATGGTTTSMLDEVKASLLSQGTLSWGKLSLRNAQQVLDEDVCSEWSADQFRRALAAMDVQLCAHLLRLARVLGKSLSSHAVDELCLRWLRDTAMFAPPQQGVVNCTGRRARQATQTLPQQLQQQCSDRPTVAVSGAVGLPRSAYFSAASSHGRVVDGDPTATLDAADVTPPQASLLSDIATPALVLPSPPSSIAPQGALRDSIAALTETATECPAAQDDMPPEPRPQAPLASRRHARESSSSSVQTGTSREEADAQTGLRNIVPAVLLRRLWRRWRDALRRRSQCRACTSRVCEQARIITARASVAPYDVPIILAGLTYTERKRVFFLHWRHHARDRRAACLLRARQVLRTWRQQTARRVRRHAELGCVLHLRAVWRCWRHGVAERVHRRLLLSSAATKSIVADDAHAANVAEADVRVSRLGACASVATQSSAGGHEEPGLSSQPHHPSSPRSAATSRVEEHPTYASRESCRVVPVTPYPAATPSDVLHPEATGADERAACAGPSTVAAKASAAHSSSKHRDEQVACAVPCVETRSVPEVRQSSEYAALQQRLAAMQAERALLVRRVIDLQMCVEEQRLLRRQAEETVAQLRHTVAEAEAREKRVIEAQQISEVEVGRLRRCIEALRQERRELLEHMLD